MESLNLDKLLERSILAGLTIDKLRTSDKKFIYVVYQTATKLLVLVPEDVKELNTYERHGRQFSIKKSLFEKYRNVDMTLIGGDGLVDMESAFSTVHFKSLDLSKLNTSEVSNGFGLFSHSIFDNGIDLQHNKLTNIKSFNRAFYHSIIPHVIFGDMQESVLEDMEYMFANTHIGKVDLSKFSGEHLTNMSSAIKESRMDELLLSKLVLIRGRNGYCTKIGNPEIDAFSIFTMCKIQRLDLSNCESSIYIPSRVYDIFSGANIQEVTFKDIKRSIGRYTE